MSRLIFCPRGRRPVRGGPGLRFSVLREVVEDGEGGDGGDLFFAHEAHGLVAELRGVVDGGDAGLRGVERAGLAHGVDADGDAEAMSFSNGGGELLRSVLVGRVEDAVNHLVGAGLVDLDEAGALLVLLADDFDELLGGVGVVGVGEDVLCGVEADGVFVSAENVDGVAADAQAWSGNEALVDGVANGTVGRARAFGSHIAFGGEAGEEIGFGGLLGEEGAPGDGFLDGLQIFRAGMEEEMDVGVDEAGEQRCVAEVDDVCALRMIDGSADGADAVALDENLAGAEEDAGVNLKQAGGVEDDGRGCGLLRGSADCDGEGEDAQRQSIE